jgi:hypothetical protein
LLRTFSNIDVKLKKHVRTFKVQKKKIVYLNKLGIVEWFVFSCSTQRSSSALRRESRQSLGALEAETIAHVRALSVFPYPFQAFSFMA